MVRPSAKGRKQMMKHSRAKQEIMEITQIPKKFCGRWLAQEGRG